VQKGIVHDAETSKKYLESYLLNSFLYNDLLAVRLSWEYTQKGNLNKVLELSEVFSASKAPRELRAAMKSSAGGYKDTGICFGRKRNVLRNV